VMKSTSTLLWDGILALVATPAAGQAQGIIDRFVCEADVVYDNPDPHPVVPCETGSGSKPPANLSACQTSDHFGTAFAVGGDWNGDGVHDIAVGGGSKPDSPRVRSQAWIYLGDAPAPALVLDGDGETDLFGSEIAFVPDISGDGRAELAVAAPNWRRPGTERRVGRVYVFFGRADGTYPPGHRVRAQSCADLILEGRVIGGRFGAALAAADVTGDQIPDLVVGAPGSGLSDQLSGFPGRVYVFDGRTLAVDFAVDAMHQGGFCATSTWIASVAADAVVQGESDRDRFGNSVATVGDLDGFPGEEFLVGAPQTQGDAIEGFAATGPGYAYVYAGDGAVVSHRISGRQVVKDDDGHVVDGEAFGWSVAGGADLDSDGVGDLIIGAFRYTRGLGGPFEVPRVGRVWVISGATLRPLLTVGGPGTDTRLQGTVSNGHFGFSVAGVADVTADARDDLLVGAYSEGTKLGKCPQDERITQGGHVSGGVYVLDGATGHKRYHVIGERSRDRLGWDVVGWDLDADGLTDVVMGGMAWTHPADDMSNNAKQEVGRAYVFKGSSLLLGPGGARDAGIVGRRPVPGLK